MSATNTGWRLLILDAPSPSLTVDEKPITLELVSPGPQGPSGAAAAVTSVNGETGAVVLDAADVGAAASVHGHAIADVSGLQGALDGKAASSHTHTASQISDSSAVGRSVLTAADAAAARSALSAAASSHGHAIGDVTGLQTALDGKAATSHTHGVGDVTGLGTAATRNAPAAGNAASSEVVLGNDSRLSDSRTPTGSAGGGLTGNYPNPSLVAPGANGRVFWHSNGGFGNSAFFVWDNTTSTMTLSNALGESVSFRPSGITANAAFTIADTGGANGTGITLDDSAESVTFANYTFIDMGGASVAVSSVQLPFGEQIQNPVNGRVDILPLPSGPNEVGITFDMTSVSNAVQIGTKRTVGGALNDGRVQMNVPIQTQNNVWQIFGGYQWSGIQHVFGSSLPQQLCIGVSRYNFGGNDNGNHVCALMNYGHVGNANRRASTLYLDPSFLVYSADVAQPNDFARLTHDQTDGLLESGNGKLRLKGASVVRIEGPSGGFDLPATAGSNGQVLTTDGTNASWQTPTGGGGGGVSEEDALALAVAL